MSGADIAKLGTDFGIHKIAQDAYTAIKSVAQQREDIMTCVKCAAIASGGSSLVSIRGGVIDVSTGAGALVLDDALQELSTLEQAAAQLVAAENKAQKQVHSVTGQG
ncbi:hypothetical protein NO2_1206 [Candidatus Termititenax persephonae]|uniref:Uncharacterized protein n=1 Tax=Candidatus Termititenax persephonae TaxID=2218525 RepID=A0A388TJP9_9BACT|nr:hypothetical protein NO2_1204 [Candidatus Termititenax persephonae]GBR76695.1 hypothetical protein NO2_1206 [Candidatus Termititenax persephonae]